MAYGYSRYSSYSRPRKRKRLIVSKRVYNSLPRAAKIAVIKASNRGHYTTRASHEAAVRSSRFWKYH